MALSISEPSKRRPNHCRSPRPLIQAGISGQLLSLREAINLADALPGGGTITFDIPMSDPGYNPATGSYTITLGHCPARPYEQCSDHRPRCRSATIDGDNQFEVFSLPRPVPCPFPA